MSGGGRGARSSPLAAERWSAEERCPSRAGRFIAGQTTAPQPPEAKQAGRRRAGSGRLRIGGRARLASAGDGPAEAGHPQGHAAGLPGDRPVDGRGPGVPHRDRGGRVVAPMSYHAEVEFLNRVTTLAVSIAIIVAALGAFLRVPRRKDLSWLSLGLVLGLVAEVILGGETVRHRLNPAFVMAHFLLSMVLIWDAVVLHHRSTLPDDAPRRSLVDRDLVRVGQL